MARGLPCARMRVGAVAGMRPRGKHVRWRSFCSYHDREAIRPHLAKLIGACMPGEGQPAPIDPELVALAAADLPPMTMRLGLLRAGRDTAAEALAELGVGPTPRGAVIPPLRTSGRRPRMPPRRSRITRRPKKQAK